MRRAEQEGKFVTKGGTLRTGGYVLCCCALLFVAACGDAPRIDPGFYGDYPVAHADLPAPASKGPNAFAQSVFFPSHDGQTVAPEAMPCPVIMVVPGFNVPPYLYHSYGEQLASWGYVAHFAYYIGLDNAASAHEVSLQIDAVEAENVRPGGVLEGALDLSRIGAAGHSGGGKYVIMAGIDDERIGAVVAMDPVDSALGLSWPADWFPSITPERMPELDVPLCLIGAEYPSIFSPAHENYHEFYLHAECIAQEVLILDSDHMSFIDDRIPGLLTFMHWLVSHPSSDHDVPQTLASRYMTAWFNVYLRGMEEHRVYLTGEQAMKDVEDGLVEISTNF